MSSRFFGTSSFMGCGVFEASPEEIVDEMSCSKCKRKKAQTTTLVSSAQLRNGGYSALRGSRLGDDESIGCPSCKRKKKRDWTLFEPPSEMMGSKPRCRVHMGQSCPISPPSAAMNCQQTSTGDTICSNNVIYSAGCPMAPGINYPGVAQDINGVPVAPPAPGAEPTVPTSGGGAPVVSAPAVSPLAIGAGALIIAGVAYALLK